MRQIVGYLTLLFIFMYSYVLLFRFGVVWSQKLSQISIPSCCFICIKETLNPKTLIQRVQKSVGFTTQLQGFWVIVFGRFFGSLWLRFALCRFKFALAKIFWLKALWHHPYVQTDEFLPSCQTGLPGDPTHNSTHSSS